MPSAISASRQALHTLLAASSALNGVQVTFGVPAGYEEREVVALTGVVAAGAEFAALGGQRKEETFGLQVAIKVHDPAGDSDTVDARGFALYEAVRDVLTGNINLSGTVRQAIVGSLVTDGVQPAVDESGTAQGCVIFLTATVNCAVRIT